MSSKEYFHEKAEESRHNELVGYLLFIAGSVFFIGGILTALSMSLEPGWFLCIPYPTVFSQAFYLELTFLGVGLFLIIAGVASAVHYFRDRNLYMCELYAASDSDTLIRNRKIQKTAAKPTKKS